MKGISGTLIAAAAAVLLLQPVARADDDALLREMKDRADIETLYWNYSRALDSLNPDAYAAVFTPDGKFGSGQTAVQGAAALKKMVSDLKDNRDKREAAGTKSAPMYHVIANHTLRFPDKDRAIYEAYWMTVFGAVGQDTPVRVAAAGRSVDELVRVNGKWLIKSRDVAPK